MTLKPALFLLTLTMLVGCTAIAAAPATPTATTKPSPTATMTPIPVTCNDLGPVWGQDWPKTVTLIDQLIAAKQPCGDEPLSSKKYAALFSYGGQLEATQAITQAITQYKAALQLAPQRQEALKALIRLNALPAPTPPSCITQTIAITTPTPAPTADLAHFVTAQGRQLMVDSKPFTVKGVNYYPRQAPWNRFIPQAKEADMAQELDLIAQAGFNTLRIFLWYEPLFTCQPELAIPNEAAFAKIDKLFALAKARHLKLIVTLNDLPDLVFRPLYTDWAHYDNQTRYIVRRYRHEAAILAWDLRNEGDIDHGALASQEARATVEQVQTWLAHISPLVRAEDPHHLLTAGWLESPIATAPYVDLLSFHHWASGAELQQRIENYQRLSPKPLLLEEVGYPSGPASDMTLRETQQAASLGEVISVTNSLTMTGWVVWTAFDFVPEPGQPSNTEHFFGLWRSDLTPKPALEKLPLTK